jgi:DNA-binding NtrC family response regulator
MQEDKCEALPVQTVPRGKILLIDDELKDLEYYSKILRGLGHEVVTCPSYVQGIRLLQREPFNLIVTSQGGSGLEGLSVLDSAMEVDRGTPVLVLARCLNLDCYLESMQMGAADYLEKPVSPDEMARVVKNHLRPRAAA